MHIRSLTAAPTPPGRLTPSGGGKSADSAGGPAVVPGGVGDGHLSWPAFTGLVRREVARALRNQHGIAVVVFSFDGVGRTSSQALVRLSAASRCVCRTSDGTGVLRNHTETGIALLFCDLRPEHTFTVVRRVLCAYRDFAHLSRKIPEPHVQAWCYPLTHAGHETNGRSIPEWQPILNDGTASPSPPPPRLPTWKRVVDVLLSTLFLIVLSPLLLSISAYIACVSRGPVLLKQPRVGYRGRIFSCWKFRTMKTAHDSADHAAYMAELIRTSTDGEGMVMTKKWDHPAIIPGGRMLRNTGLDELPQLLNVLRGEMSLVGPRPPVPYEVELYEAWHAARFQSLPGITGLWQVSGKNRLTFREMVRLDIRYGRSLTPWSDVTILMRTPVAILRQLRDARKAHKEVTR